MTKKSSTQITNPFKLTLFDIKSKELPNPKLPTEKRQLCVLTNKKTSKHIGVFTTNKNKTPIILAFTPEIASLIQTQSPLTYNKLPVAQFIQQNKNNINPLILTEISNIQTLPTLFGIDTTKTYSPPHNFPPIPTKIYPSTQSQYYIKFLPLQKAFQGTHIKNKLHLYVFKTPTPSPSILPYLDQFYSLPLIKKILPHLKFIPIQSPTF